MDEKLTSDAADAMKRMTEYVGRLEKMNRRLLLTAFILGATILTMIASCAASDRGSAVLEEPVSYEVVDASGEVNAQVMIIPGVGPMIRCMGDRTIPMYEDTPAGWGPTVYLRNVRFARVGSITTEPGGGISLILDKDDWFIRDQEGTTIF